MLKQCVRLKINRYAFYNDYSEGEMIVKLTIICYQLYSLIGLARK